MAEFESVEDAKLVVEALHGSNIYPECCSMKVEFCKKEGLTVKRNDNISWDFTIKISEGTSRGCSTTRPWRSRCATTGTGSVIIKVIIINVFSSLLSLSSLSPS